MSIKSEIKLNMSEIKPLVYIGILSLISLFFNLSYLFIFGMFILVIRNREWLLSVLLMPALIDGALNHDELLITLGILNVVLLLPILYFFNINSKISLPPKFRFYFIALNLMLVLGVVVYHFKFGADSDVVIENFFKAAKILFFFILLKFLINQKFEYFINSIKKASNAILVVILVVTLYTFFHGDSHGGNFDYLVFADAKHGTFSATLSAFSTFAVYNFFNVKDKALKWFYLGYLITVFILILNLGSKNGLLSFSLVIILGFLFLVHAKQSFKKVLIIFASVVVLGSTLFIFSDKIVNSPTIHRMTTQVEVGGIERAGSGRTELLESAFLAFPDAPVFGWGASKKAPRYVSANYGNVSIPNVIHNIYVDILVQYGLIGVSLFIGFTLLAFRYGRITYRYCKKIHDSLLFIIPIMGISLVFSGMFVPWSWEVIVWYVAIYILAIGYKVSMIPKSSNTLKSI